jgi:hypothetical protein
MLGAAVALVAASGEVRGVESPRRVLHVAWVDVDSVAPRAFDAMARESSAILHDAGVDLVWERVEVGLLPEESDLAVILLNSPPPRAALQPRCLGAVNPANPRAVWMYFPNIAWLLGSDKRRWSEREVGTLGVALGRVAAHEIVHLLAPGLRHTSRGLMAERLGRADLVGTRNALDADSLRALSLAAARRTARTGP